MKRTASFFGFALTTLALVGCAAHRAVINDAQGRLSVDRLAADIATLASDEFEGRGPGTSGEEKTIAFLKRRYRELGLEPGNGDSYVQEVPLVKVTIDTSSLMVVKSNGAEQRLRFGRDFAASYSPMREKLSLENAELVFVGYGAADTTYGWDDYAEIDVEGEVVVILWNDPGFVGEDTTFFMGKESTRSASTRTKYRVAAEHGAVGALVIVDTTMSTPRDNWERLSRRLVRPSTSPLPEEADTLRAVMNGYLEVNAGRALLAQAGYSYDSLLVAATKREFKPFSLGFNLSTTLQKQIEPFTSGNVVGILPGSKRPDEVVIYTAHWDHVGMDTTREGDQIFNGALDNASGTAGILALAELFNGLEKRPERSILFMAVTSEESGLLGSRYYTEHPLYPLTKTAAAINLDFLFPFGKTKDVIVIGLGKSQIDDYVEAAAKRLGMYIRADLWPEERYYNRSDHINFARKGVPSMFMWTGMESAVNGEEWTLAQYDDYHENKYHKPSDEYDHSWDLSGAMEALGILFDVGYTISNQYRFPNWYKGDEFRPVRDAALKAASNQENNSQ